MRWIRWTTLVLLVGLAGSGAAFGDEPPAGGGSPGGAPDALAEGMAALRIRMEAKMKEADLLMKAGRTDEALAALRGIDSMYEEGLKDLRALAGRPAAVPRPPGGRRLLRRQGSRATRRGCPGL